MKKSVFVILLVLFISAFSISMYFVVKETIEDKKQYEVFENIVSSVHVEDAVLIIQMRSLKDMSN